MAGRVVSSLRINIDAGTAQAVLEMNKLNAKFTDFGRIAGTASAHSVSGVQATSGALRVLEGNMTNNLRAAERFLANTLKLGPALQVAFPVVGAIAALGVVGELVKKVTEFITTMRDAPKVAQDAFSKINTSLRVTNDGLDLSAARLRNEIAQLQGKPVNHLAEALLEAKEAADKLNESLVKTIAEEDEALKKEAGPWYQRAVQAVAGKAGLQDLADETLEFQRKIAGSQNLTTTRSLLAGELAKYQAQLVAAQAYQSLHSTSAPSELAKNAELGAFLSGSAPGTRPQTAGAAPRDLAGNLLSGDMADRAAALRNRINDLKQALVAVGGTETVSALKKSKAGLEDIKQSADLARPVVDKLNALQAELLAAQQKLVGVGTVSGQVMAEGMGKAAKDIEAVNRELEKKGPADQLNALQALQIIFADTAIAAAEAETKWQEAFSKGTAEIHDRIAALQSETAAIGGTYAQRQKAFVAAKLPQAVGAERYNDPAWMADPEHQKQVAALSTGLSKEFAEQESEGNAKSLSQLQDRIRLLTQVAAAERNGAEAVKYAELEERIRVATRGMDIVAAQKLRAAIIEESVAERSSQSEKELAALRERAASTDLLANAYGHAARVQAEAQNAYSAAIQSGKGPAVAQAEALAVIQKDQAAILTDANKLATEYSDQLSTITRTMASLKGIAATQGNTLDIETQLKKLEQDRLKLMVDQSLAQGSARDGIHAFFLEMQEQGKQTAAIIKDALDSVVNDSTSTLAKMLTQPKPKGGWGKEWGKEFGVNPKSETAS